MTRLTAEQVKRAAGGAAEVKSLDLSFRALTDVSYLSELKNLERLELKGNCLTSLESLSTCVNLKWLSVAENKLESLKGIEGLPKLTVLNAGKNKLKTIDEVQSIKSLRALILNDNNILTICKLDQLQQLNTLVLSHNPVADIGNAFAKLKTITKLSLSHCQIQKIGSSLAACLELRELRLAHNNIIDIPPELSKNTKIEILDLGNNLIERHSGLKVLSALHRLKNLSLLGNPIAGKDNLAKKVKSYVPSLRIFNAKPIELGLKKDNLEPGTAAKEDKSKPEVQKKRSRSAVVAANTEGEDLPVSLSSNRLSKKEKKGKRSNSLVQNERKDASGKYEHDADKTTEIEAKRKKLVSNEEQRAKGLDDTETSFVDLITARKEEDSDAKNREHERVLNADTTGVVVIKHAKKKPKDQRTASSFLNLVHSASNKGFGGIGGLPTWDD